MSHNEKKLFWTPLLVVLSLSGGLMFAFGRGPVPPVESNVSPTNIPTETSGTARQRDFNRYHDLTVEMISVNPDGFQPARLTRPAGRFLLGINNRSGLKELTFHLTREDGRLMQEARVNPKQPKWRSIVTLPVGRYRLTETEHADWVCDIVITPHR
jgi:hypothetical protein